MPLHLPDRARPSYASGYARSASESAYPWLWLALSGAWVPKMGFSGNVVPDLSGHGQHATTSWNETVEHWPFYRGPAIRAASATNGTNNGIGGNDLLQCGRCDNLVGTKNVTVVCWYEKLDSFNRISAAFGVGALGFASTMIGAHIPYNDGIVYWDFGNNSGNNRVTVSGLTVTGSNVWAFRAGDLGSQIFQNGILVGSKTVAISRTLFGTTQQFNWFNGAGPSGSDNAILHAGYIYNRNLTQEEIIILSNDPLAPFRLKQPAPRAPIVAPAPDFTAVLAHRDAILGRTFMLGTGTADIFEDVDEFEEEVEQTLNLISAATYTAEYLLDVESTLALTDEALSPVDHEEEVESELALVGDVEAGFGKDVEDTLLLVDSAEAVLFIDDAHHIHHTLDFVSTADGDNADVEEVESELELVQTLTVLGPIYEDEFSDGDVLALTQTVNGFLGVPWLPIEIEHVLAFAQRLGRAHEMDAENELELEGEAFNRYTAESILTLVDTMEYGKGSTIPDADLALEQEVLHQAEYVRSVSHTGFIDHSFTYFIDSPCNLKRYMPFEGGTASMPTQRLQSRSTFTMETTVGPHTLLVLRNPEVDNRDRLGFNRVNRETRGGELNVYRDSSWAEVNTLLFTIIALKHEKIEALQAFLLATLGQEVKIHDWTGTSWKGVVTTPNETATEDQDGYWTFSFEFEGIPYEGQAPDGQMQLTSTAVAVLETP